MSRRSVRIFLLLLAVSAAAAAIHRALSNEYLRQDLRAAATTGDRAAGEALVQASELRGSLHAYVAAGQGVDFWKGRVATLLDATRARILELERIHAGGSAELLDDLDRIAAAEARVRDRLSEEQPLLAADIVFSEVRDLVDSVVNRVAGIRSSMALDSGAREAALIREQYLLAGGALGVWVFVALLLLPRVNPLPALESGVLHVAPLGTITASKSERRAASTAPAKAAPSDIDRPQPAPGAGADQAPATPLVNAAGASPPRASIHAEWSELARICAELATLTDVASLDPLLARSAALLDATGLILWIATPEGDRLHVVASHGYDPKLVARLGSVARDASNLTSAVFRDGVPHTSASSPGSPAAVAVPLFSAGGASGVLSLELAAEADADRAAAGAAIIAAQLSAALAAPPDAAQAGRTYAAG